MTKDLTFLLYASHDGHTRQIIRHLAAALMEEGQAVSVYNLAEREPPFFMIEEAASVMIVSPVRYGHHLPAIDRFIKKHKLLLNQEKLGMVSINLTARKSDKNTPATNPYYKKWLCRHKLEPAIQAVFAGRLEYRLYRWWEVQIIRLIMKITGGPTQLDTVIDYTKWAAVNALAKEIAIINVKKQEVA